MLIYNSAYNQGSKILKDFFIKCKDISTLNTHIFTFQDKGKYPDKRLSKDTSNKMEI